VEDQLARQAAALSDSLARLDRSPAVLVVESRPAGAEVLVDGVLVGKAPIELPLAGGTHRVQTRIAGHEPREREFTAVRGVRERWSVTLPAIVVDAAPVERPPRREPLVPTGAAFVGVSAAALAVGIPFIVLHHDPYRARCSGDDYDADDDLCRYRWNSLTAGATLVAVGGALAIAGTTMLVVGSRRRARRDARARLELDLAPDLARTRAGVVLVGRF
jgi:hypothetical protein